MERHEKMVWMLRAMVECWSHLRDAASRLAQQKAPLASTFGDNVTAPAWKKKPCWYQVSGEDRMINPENQKHMLERMKARKAITMAASHASLASKPVEVSGLIDEAATALAKV